MKILAPKASALGQLGYTQIFLRHIKDLNLLFPGFNSRFIFKTNQHRTEAKHLANICRRRHKSSSVPRAGYDPARPFGQWGLNPSRLPISPSRDKTTTNYRLCQIQTFAKRQRSSAISLSSLVSYQHVNVVAGTDQKIKGISIRSVVFPAEMDLSPNSADGCEDITLYARIFLLHQRFSNLQLTGHDALQSPVDVEKPQEPYRIRVCLSSSQD